MYKQTGLESWSYILMTPTCDNYFFLSAKPSQESLPSNIITNCSYWSDVSKWRRVKELIMDSCDHWDDIRRFSILNVLMKRFPLRNARSSLSLSTIALTFCRDKGVAYRGVGIEKKVLVKCKHKSDKSLLIRLNGKIIHSKCYCKVLSEFLVLCSRGPLRPMRHRQIEI